VQEATSAQHAEWKQSRDQAISDGEIDLDARNDPDEWNVYLTGRSPKRTRFGARTNIETASDLCGIAAAEGLTTRVTRKPDVSGL
jgi:hypothetical protein